MSNLSIKAMENISEFGNQSGFYNYLANQIESEELLNDNDIQELVIRLEAFIEQEIQELRDENWEEYNTEEEEE